MTSETQPYIQSFAERLDSVTVESLSLESYPSRYLQLLLDSRVYYLHIYANVLELLLSNTSKKKEEIILVDYGAGNGLLGMFAKYCGFKKVYLNDVSKIFIEASKKLSHTINISVDGFIEGDWTALPPFFKAIELPDGVVGTDVVEHIYSLEDFFEGIKKLNERMVTVFTTASVTANPFKSRQLMKLQYQDEYKGSNAEHAMPGDEFAGMPFLEIRKRLIKKSFSGLDEKKIATLAKATRGMNEQDIMDAVSRYTSSSTLPQPLTHPTNTCDPVTGSWTERLLSVREYESVYKEAGFSLQVYNGFYNEWQRGIKGSLLGLLNKTIALLGKQGNYITPFITLVGKEN